MRKKAWKILKYFIFPSAATLVGIFLMVWTVSQGKPEYSALVIALMGIAFSIWWDTYKEIVNRRRNKLAVLSQLNMELMQNRNTIKSILETEEHLKDSSNPAPMRTQAWQTAAASPYFVWVKTEIIGDLISIYGRLDTATYYADIFKTMTYTPGETTYKADESARNTRALYLIIFHALSSQIDQVLSKISTEIEELKI